MKFDWKDPPPPSPASTHHTTCPWFLQSLDLDLDLSRIVCAPLRPPNSAFFTNTKPNNLDLLKKLRKQTLTMPNITKKSHPKTLQKPKALSHQLHQPHQPTTLSAILPTGRPGPPPPALLPARRSSTPALRARQQGATFGKRKVAKRKKVPLFLGLPLPLPLFMLQESSVDEFLSIFVSNLVSFRPIDRFKRCISSGDVPGEEAKESTSLYK